MSIKDKAAAAASMFKIDNAPTPPIEGRAPATVMGQTAADRAQTLKTRDHIQELETQLNLHAGSVPVRELDPNTIRPSAFANRDVLNFTTIEFNEFKQQIAISGINTQPILVRPIKKLEALGEGTDKFEYEIVYGHRRHRASLELGLNVRAEIRQINDIELFAAMTTENLNREDLSAWEWGRHLSRALELKLYQTQNQIAAAHGINQSTVTRYIAVFNFPTAVLDAFPSKLAIKFSWIDALQQALKQRKEQVLGTANGLKQVTGLSAEKVFAKLTKDGAQKIREKSLAIEVKGKKIGSISRVNGAVVVKLPNDVVGEGREKALAEVVTKFLTEEGTRQR